MSASPDDLAADVLAILSDAERLEALSRTRPHVFAEQKGDLVRRLKDLHFRACDARSPQPSRLPGRTTTFSPGKIRDRKGNIVVAERRKSRLVQARSSSLP